MLRNSNNNFKKLTELWNDNVFYRIRSIIHIQYVQLLAIVILKVYNRYIHKSTMSGILINKYFFFCSSVNALKTWC